MNYADTAERLADLSSENRILEFLRLNKKDKAEVFSHWENPMQEDILKSIGNDSIADILNNMPPDDRTELLEDFPDELIKQSINLLNDKERKIAVQLLGYPEDSIARLMTPHYIQIREEWTVERCLEHIRKIGHKMETISHLFVVDQNNKLLDDMPIKTLLLAQSNQTVADLCDYNVVFISSLTSKEDAIPIFEKYDRSALPIISENGILVGIVTIDDILDQVNIEHTEDMQKFGGLESLDLPYIQTGLFEMVKKRATWLVILFLSEMLTASAMAYYDMQIEKAVVLALFVPLIISSGGNSGSQAATLIIRAMALKEIGLRDWWYVMRREIFSGFLLGVILGVIGFIRISIWQEAGFYDYGVHWVWIAITIASSLVAVVLWGSLSGSMIPFILKAFKLDPATSSAPFVATLVDVTGLIIYFTVAGIFLTGKLL